MSGAPYFAERLAQQILSYPSTALPAEIAEKTTDCVFDAIACALAGVSAVPTKAARTVAAQAFASGSEPVWFAGQSLGVVGAAWCNSMAASVHDLDDGHRLARGHPGAAIVPAVLATIADTGAAAADVLAAIAIGYEVAIAIAAAQRDDRIQTHQTGRWIGIGVASACGRLAQLSVDQMTHALALAGVWAPNQLANGSSGYARETGNWAKEGIPLAVVTGMTAVLLAKEGFTGPKDFLDHTTHYDFAGVTLDPLHPDAILATYFKRYGCCRYIHPALDAYRQLSDHAAIEAGNIARIEVSTFAWALRLQNRTHPASLVEAQYSLPFCLAVMACRGADALLPMDETILSDAAIVDLAERVELTVDAAINRRFPRETGACLKIVMASGRTVETGQPVVPRSLKRDDLRVKYASIARSRLSAEGCAGLLDALLASSIELKGVTHFLQTTVRCV